MTTPRDRKAAKDFVRQIAEDHGYVAAEEFQRIPDPELRRKLEVAFLQKDILIGSSVITLAKNLYSSKARFVFELLQNADDNSYTQAGDLGHVPHVSFSVYPDRVVLECNEDGFTTTNLAAICSVGKSSKTAAHGYIGEKGIGFKSVFMAAYKVHIQSGAFSFSFTHRSGQSGMGMISPEWEEDGYETLEPPLTRITMYLHSDGNADAMVKLRKSIRSQFLEIQETFLLFMKRLRSVDVAFYDEDGENTYSATYSANLSEHHAIVEKCIATDESTTRDSKHYHLTTHQVTKLSKHDHRTYPNDEGQHSDSAKSEIILAFPISEDSLPITDIQSLFVFLPVRRVGFKFIIQADFVTDASRQDVVKDSLRNNDLLDGIADAFVKAVLQLCGHETLKYKWMRYLPDKNDKSLEPLWLALANKIIDRVGEIATVYGQIRPDRRFVRHLCRLPRSTLDENGMPLFPDGDPEKIISQRYNSSDLDILGNNGLGYATWAEMLQWLSIDLAKGSLSRMRCPTTPGNWHTRAAKLICGPFDNKWVTEVAALKAMELLPLVDGSWVSASSGPVYFARTQELNIPTDVHLRLVSEGMGNHHRVVLFRHLGVTTAPPQLVRKQILQRYIRLDKGDAILPSLEDSKNHLSFLYHTEHIQDDDEPTYSGLAIYTQKQALKRPAAKNIYIDDDESYGPRELCRRTDPGPKPGDGAPGLDADFVHEEYFSDAPATPPEQNVAWRQWFHESLSVDKYMAFDDSRVAEYVAEHRPEKLLGALCIWYQCPGSRTSGVEDFRFTEVLCRGGRRIHLKDTYFPTVELERRVARFVEPGAFFPWLYLDGESTHEAIPAEWRSLLKVVDAGLPSSELTMALDMLGYSLDAFSSIPSMESRARLFDLYHLIQSKYRESEDRKAAADAIRDIFSNSKCIYIPLSSNECSWAFPYECVWKAPQDMSATFALQRLYAPFLHAEGADSSSLEYLFKTILKITDCNWKTCIADLRDLKASGCTDIDRITGLYEALDDLHRDMTTSTQEKVQAAFDAGALIYLPSVDGSMWHTAEQCVWSSAATLRGRISLNEDYEDLKSFFVDFIGVKPVDILMAVDELKEAGHRQPLSVEAVTESLWTVNSLLSVESDPPSPEGILGSCVFPVRFPNGAFICVSTATEFFIVDRELLGKSFAGKVKLFAFTLEEVVQLQPFIAWTGISKRNISICVRHSTSFQGGGETPISNPERQIGNRAHALVRVAAHFGSPRTQSRRGLETFYEVMRNSVEMRGTDGIASVSQLSQDGISHEVEGKRTTLFIDDLDRGATVYLPRQKDEQEYAFTKLLARRLFEWMMEDKSPEGLDGVAQAGINATRDVLLSPRTMLATALDDNGIASIGIENRDQQAVPETPTPVAPQEHEGFEEFTSGDNDSDLEFIGTPSSSVTNAPHTFDVVSRSSRYESVQAAARTYSVDPSSLSARLSTPARAAQPHTVTDDSGYIGLLHKVIAAARRGTIPGVRTAQLSATYRDAGTNFRLRGEVQIERDLKIGAAGELYVFELLSHLGLPSGHQSGFSISNWKSNIRRYVKVHPKYYDLESWQGMETSDIVYTDSTSLLTNIFIEAGHLAREWEGRTPEYFIEVKSTVSTSEAPFFMSKAQYSKMRRAALTADNCHTVYVIFRVYNLGRDDMALDVQLDPASLEASGQLQFTAETWSVVPAA